MDNRAILRHVDSTVLSQDVTWEQVRACCDDGIRYGVAQVCVPPCYVRRAKEYVGEQMRIGTGIGYPNGYNTTAVKVYEAQQAVHDGADELDMVIQVGWAKEGEFDRISEEIRAVRAACKGKILKVIIETYFLSEKEKLRLCDCVTESGADFIKTSTGFVSGGATPEDVQLMLEHVGEGVRVKAAGGIATLEEAQRYLEMGAVRLGSSKLVQLVKRIEETAMSKPQ